MKALFLSVLLGFSTFASAVEFSALPVCHGPAVTNQDLLAQFAPNETSKSLGRLKLLVFKQRCSNGGCGTPIYSLYGASDAILASYTFNENEIGRIIDGPLSEEVEVFANRIGDKVELEVVWIQPNGNRISTTITEIGGDSRRYLTKYDKNKTFQLGMHERWKRVNVPFGNTFFNFDNTGCIYMVNGLRTEASSNVSHIYHFVLSGQLPF